MSKNNPDDVLVRRLTLSKLRIKKQETEADNTIRVGVKREVCNENVTHVIRSDSGHVIGRKFKHIDFK